MGRLLPERNVHLKVLLSVSVYRSLNEVVFVIYLDQNWAGLVPNQKLTFIAATAHFVHTR